MASSCEQVEIPNFGHLVANPDDVWWTDNFCIHTYAKGGKLETNVIPRSMKATLFFPVGPPRFFSNQMLPGFIHNMFLHFNFPHAPAPFIQGTKLYALAHYSRRPVPLICCHKPSTPYFLPHFVAVYNCMNRRSTEPMFFIEETVLMMIMLYLQQNNMDIIYIPIAETEFRFALCNPRRGSAPQSAANPEEEKMFGSIFAPTSPVNAFVHIWQ